MAKLLLVPKCCEAGPGCADAVLLNEPSTMAENGILECSPSPPSWVKPPILKARPKGVSCGPKAPTWQAVQGCPVCAAKLGTAAAGRARANIPAANASVAKARMKRMVIPPKDGGMFAPETHAAVVLYQPLA